MFQTSHRSFSTKPHSLQGAGIAVANLKNRTRRSYGFSLVEVMVAMVIGLLGMIVMMQVYSTFEGQKRTTTGGDDAQNAGAIALYGLQRDIQQSGWGVSAFNLIGCNVQLRAGPVTLNSIAPVTINHASITGQDTNTDTLLIVYGKGNGGQEGDNVTAAPPAGFAGINIYAVASPNEFAVNDRVVSQTQVRPTPCNLVLDTVTGVAGANVTLAAGLAGMTNGTLYNLGTTQKILAYAIRNSNLTACDYTANDCGSAANNGNTAIWVPIANNIVSMKAQYGRDTNANPMDGIVDLYDKTTPTTACGWIKTSSVRIALVARNSQSIQIGITAAAPVWAGTTTVAAAAPVAGNTADPINISLNPDGTANTTWQNYRYKLFQTIVPIRNIAVKGVQAGC